MTPDDEAKSDLEVTSDMIGKIVLPTKFLSANFVANPHPTGRGPTWESSRNSLANPQPPLSPPL